jgi:hypothetical protein
MKNKSLPEDVINKKSTDYDIINEINLSVKNKK